MTNRVLQALADARAEVTIIQQPIPIYYQRVQPSGYTGVVSRNTNLSIDIHMLQEETLTTIT